MDKLCSNKDIELFINAFIKVVFLSLLILFDFSFSQNTVSKSFLASCPSQAVGFGYTGEGWGVSCSWSFNPGTNEVTVYVGSSYSAACSRTFSVDSGLINPVLSSRSAFHFSSLSGTYSANGITNSCSCSATASQNVLNGSGIVECSSPSNCNGTFFGTDFCSLSLDFQHLVPQNIVSKSFSTTCPSQAVGFGYTGEGWGVSCSWSFNPSTHEVGVSLGSSYSPSCSRSFSVDSNLVTPALSSLSASHSSSLSGYYGNPPIGCSCSATASSSLTSYSGGVNCSAPGSTYCIGTFFGTDYCSLSLDFRHLVPCDSSQTTADNYSSAQSIFFARQAECKADGGNYFGGIAPQANGKFCLEGRCYQRGCFADEPVAEAFLSLRQTECQANNSEFIGGVVPQDNDGYCVEGRCRPDYCFATEVAAEARLDTDRAECESQGKDFYSKISLQSNGDYCVEETCKNYTNCLSENSDPPALRKNIYFGNSKSVPKEEYYDDYSQQCRPQPLYYDALGRKTKPRPETRRFLFDSKTDKSVTREKGFGMATPLKRESVTGQCCVSNFGLNLVNATADLSMNDKFGVHVEFNATFYGEEHEAGCNPSCCEYKQEVKGFVKSNGNYITGTNCKIDGQLMYLDSTEYIQDCYGRDCTYFGDSRESYDDDLDTYAGNDYPGLTNTVYGDSVNIRMEFNSYIKDRCNAYEVKDSKYWGFHIQGIVPAYPDSLEVILLGEIAP